MAYTPGCLLTKITIAFSKGGWSLLILQKEHVASILAKLGVEQLSGIAPTLLGFWRYPTKVGFSQNSIDI